MIPSDAAERGSRGALLLVACGFALLAVGPLLTLAHVPAHLEVEREMRALQESDAEFKGGHWTRGDFERRMDDAAVRLGSVGDVAMLVGAVVLVGVAWASRTEIASRRILGAFAVIAVVFLTAGFLRLGLYRGVRAPDWMDAAQLALVLGALAIVAASRGSRLALALGLAGAAVGAFRVALTSSEPWLAAQLGPSMRVALVATVLWLSYALLAAAFAAGASHGGGEQARPQDAPPAAAAAR